MGGRSIWASLTAVDTDLVEPYERKSSRGSAQTSERSEYRDLPAPELIEHAIRRGEGRLASGGALAVDTGSHTGRSPHDKFIVQHGPMAQEIAWGAINRPISPQAFALLHADVVQHLARGDRYRMDLSAGADAEFALPVRLVTESAWSATFARNLFLPALPRRRGGRGVDDPACAGVRCGSGAP